ncbi:hypothetical protein CKO25_16715 [Thiocapsa imhoffii]|uniref:L,D-TPase catalytic domain-containing protein n=2 Tax=Thiocapsa imhoffii TaxID=382777 RepID=A0A9X0WK76_9GAMM|nr:hypothetical protein [Thiocapsa imhoffii]
MPAAAMAYLPFPTAAADALVGSDMRPTAPTRAGQADRVVVKKAERRLYLMRGSEPIRTYEIALGFQPIGHKARQGDGKTPEGRYRLDWRNDRSQFYKALHISYPNAQDRHRAHRQGQDPGGLILIHGQGRTSRPTGEQGRDWTHGCIAVSNQDIDEIWSLTMDGLPIDILP